MPMVNQIEFNAFQQAKELLACCSSMNIVCQGYSPLAKAERMTHPAVLGVAQAIGVTAAQLLIRWSLQKGVPVIPKTTRPSRVAENLGVFEFEISEEQMGVLDALDC